ncbi:3-hydroxyacyl-CoA dehydrogenase NAD-binding domain-containing protein [Psychromarinibacter sp. C21-152]|uniref:3-hydroxyacyl-CoA dehydrogenase NAD-binding domain-containing protein n=1 Tax=Psychromarinibacter sediminicola TaxID=3033385 RepID=A0AAE3T8L1_9RHOB|nr:3-hydroxyacyl-CoA dehydrogenase NAD-binding domain-containing protein [Psychromarinibacter sediminicola]MDF0601372.1 3-hydroxyacyl-CoA dehydrogenase NAD-binding domain-containing protein [Psychromarinibacter sediminicola]
MNTQSAAAADSSVTYEMRDGIAVLRIDNPPVNVISHAVRSGIVDAIDRATADGARGAVLTGAGRCFVAGSDLSEFGKPIAAPELPDVIRSIEAAPFPVVAATHGVALGGGLELALGCDYRIAAPGTMLGLPEVSLGLVPGAGGTQRVPRLVGWSRAIELICAARRIPAARAFEIGLIDAVAEGDLLDDARAFLAGQERPKRRAIRLQPPAEADDDIDAAAEKALRRGKGRPNVAEAIRLVKATAGADAEAALKDERAVFQELRTSDDAVALRYLFFAERRAATVAGLDKALARDVATVGVVGGGTMGQGIALACLAAGLSVTLIERDDDALDRALSAVAGRLDASVSKGRLTRDAADMRRAALTGAVDYETLSGCDLVIEAVFEDMAVKTDVLARLDRVLAPGAALATNTSYLDIDAMSAGLAHRDRVVGLHFFSPADVMTLLEIVRAEATSDAVLATALGFARTLGKQPVVARVAEGFIGNRVFAAYRRRAELLVLDGASPQQVDEAIVGFGFAMGPFAVADMSGLDIAWAMRKRQAPDRDPKARYVTIPDRLCEAGRLGRKAGKGWYDHSGGTPRPDPEVDTIIDAARAAAGVTPADYDAETIRRQLLAAIVNEAACLLEDGIAERPSDVDVALVHGYGFPRWRGGPLYWASRQDRAAIEADLVALAEAVGHGHRAGPVGPVLDRLGAELGVVLGAEQEG